MGLMGVAQKLDGLQWTIQKQNMDDLRVPPATQGEHPGSLVNLPTTGRFRLAAAHQTRT